MRIATKGNAGAFGLSVQKAADGGRFAFRPSVGTQCWAGARNPVRRERIQKGRVSSPGPAVVDTNNLAFATRSTKIQILRDGKVSSPRNKAISLCSANIGDVKLPSKNSKTNILKSGFFMDVLPSRHRTAPHRGPWLHSHPSTTHIDDGPEAKVRSNVIHSQGRVGTQGRHHNRLRLRRMDP